MTFDWQTLGLEAVNVAVLVWLLARFFWRPLAAIIARRQAVIAQDLAAAEAGRNEAAKALADVTATRAGLAKEREALLAQAAAAADKEHAARLAAAAGEIDALRAAAQAAIAKEKSDAGKAWRAEAARLAVDIAGRLVARLEGAVPAEAFLEGVLRQIEALPPAQRRGLGAGALRLVSAHALAPQEQAHCRARLAAALGADAALSFETDPGLIAGLALHGANLVVADNWRLDLDHILAGISDAA